MAKTLEACITLLLVIAHCGSTHEAKFYQGCSNSAVSWKQVNGVDQSQLPFSCIAMCISNRFSFAAVQNGSYCFCSQSISLSGNTTCGIRCPSNLDLHCGDTYLKSMYSTAVPVISATLIDIKSKAIPINTMLVLEATVLIKSPQNVVKDLQSIQGMNRTLNSLYITWKLDDKPWNSTTHSIVGNTTNILRNVSFHQPGSHQLCITFNNLVSEKHHCITVEVSLPISRVHLIDIEPKITVAGYNTTFIKVEETFYIKFTVDKGSGVNFSISFGDSSAPMNISTRNSHSPMDATCVTVPYKYSKCGTYLVNVETTNAISTESLQTIRLYAQKNFKNERVSIVEFGTCPGKPVNITVTLSHGKFCGLNYKWILTYDKGQVIRTKEPYIELVFNKTGRYTVGVKLCNTIGCLSQDLSVFVQNPLMNATLSIKGSTASLNHIYKETGSDVIFQVDNVPNNIGVKYKWHFNTEMFPGRLQTFDKEFDKPGRYVTYVEATDKLGTSVASNKLYVVIEDVIDQVTLEHKGVIILHQNISFSANVKHGSNVRFLWDFGDGSIVENTTQSQIAHKYKISDQYNIKVMVYNHISHQNVSRSIFVTRIPSCQPPAVKILGWEEITIYRYEEVHLESQVTLNCNWTNAVLIYEWKIVPISKKAIKPETISMVTSEPVLIIPPYTLNYGTYEVVLKVHKNATVLSSEQRVLIKVHQHGLVAAIKGGSMRVVGYESEETISLDGSDSNDPDFPHNQKDLRFKWECHLLNDNTTSCFDPQFNLPLNKPVLSFQTKQLLAGKDALMVFLTISKNGMKNSSTWQILRMVNADPHLLTLRCPQCENGLVNPNDPLVLRGYCTTCPWTNQNLTFEWNLYLITNENLDWEVEKCVPRRKIKQDVPQKIIKSQVKPTHIYVTPRPLARFTTRPFPGRISTSTLPFKRVAQNKYFPNLNTDRPTGTYEPNPTTKRPSHDIIIQTGTVCRNKITKNQPTVSPTNCKFVTRRPTYGVFPTKKFYICSPSGPFRTPYPSGHGSVHTGRGSVTGPFPVPSSGRNPITNPMTQPTTATATEADLSTSKTVTPTPTEDSDKLSSMYDPEYMVPTTQQQHTVLSIRRNIFDMASSWSDTGLTNRNLVLNENILMNDRTFMIALNVKDNTAKGLQYRRGMANVFFKVNKNPNIGTCDAQPEEGFEMETEFMVVCKDGSNRNKPLKYRITYKIIGDEDNQEFLIYSGTNTQPSFVLPSGKEEYDYTVTLHVSVFNEKGTSLKVCPMLLKVKPTVIPNSETSTEEYLLNKTRDHHIKNLIKVGEEQKVKQLINVIAKALNRLNPVKNNSLRQSLRIETRAELLKVIKKFRIRDIVSAVESGEALDAITRVKEELHLEELEIASELISHVESQITKDATSKPDGLSTILVNLVTRLASNLMSASSHLFKSRSDISYKNIQLKCLQVVQNIIKTKLKHFILGEKPLKVTHPTISAIASQSQTISQSVWALKNVTIVLPSTLQQELGINHPCMGTTMIVYEANPYAWSETDALYHTKTSSFVLSTCKGVPKQVQNLHNQIDITLPWTLSKNEEPKSIYSVKWQYLNVHHIYTNHSMINQSLHLRVQTLSKLEHGFVLKVLVNTNTEKLDPKKAKTFKSTPGGHVDFHLTARELANSSGFVGLGIVMEDTALNRIKKLLNVRSVSYSITSKWIGCFYWNQMEEAWSTSGCSSTSKMTDTVVNCRCNHLTTFIGKALWAPNPLISFKDLRKTSSLENNPIALTLVLCLIAAYIILLICCYKLDKHDERKGGLVYLARVPCRSSYRYKITVETGHWFGSGTTASVVLRMFAEANTSDPIELQANDKPLFERGSRDVFIFDSPTDLSPLWKIHIWHYNQGNSPGWYLNRIIVKDMASNEKWYFNNYRWLAVDEEDGKIDVELMPNGTRDSIFKKNYHNIIRYFMDYHLWMSVIGRPPYSRFNRKQRLTCCLSLILSFLCVNAAWFHISIQTKPLQILGFLDITWETVVYGMVCGLIVVPVNLLWIMMFRYAKPPKPSVKVHPAPYDDPATETSYLVNGADYIQDTVSILDQTIETLLYLKTLGNRIKLDPSYLNDKASMDSVFENVDGGRFAYSTAGSVGASSVAQTKIPTSPVEGARYPGKSCSSWGKESQQTSAITNIARFLPKKSFSLPSSFVYIAWIGCFLTMLVSGVFTVWYGLSFGPQKSMIWLQSLSFSVLESLLISQPIMVLAIPIFTLCYYATSVTDTKVGPANEEDLEEGPYVNRRSRRNDDMQINLKAALDARRHQRYLKFLKPLTKNALSDFTEKAHVRRVFIDYIREFTTSLILLVLVCLLVSGMYCRHAFNIQNTFQNTMLRHSDDKVDKVHFWWKSNHNRIVELLYWNPNERSLQKNQTPEIYFKDTSSVLIGRPRIRQYRTTRRKVCKDDSFERRNSTNATQQCSSRCFMGEGLWSSIELNRTRSGAVAQLMWLTSVGWISWCTTHIKIEFLLYTASSAVYSAVSWEITGPASGIPHVQVRVKSMKDVFKDTKYKIFLTICKAIFVAAYAFCLHHEFIFSIRTKTKYFKNAWKYVEVFCLLLCSLSLIMYVSWSVSLYSLVREILTEVDDNVFGAGEIVYQRQELLIILYGMIVFVLILKIIHLMRIFQFVQRFCNLLWTASGLLLGFTVIFLFLMTMFSHVGFLLFGRVHFNFKAFSSIFVLACGLFRNQGTGYFVDMFSDDNRILSILYLASYIAVVIIILRGLSMSVFNSSFRITRRKHLQTHLMYNYLLNLHRNFRRQKLVEEESDQEEEDLDEDEMEEKQIIPVEYACDEVEFQMEELLFKMDNLVGEGGLANVCISSSSDMLLSSDDCDDDVEYLYRQGTDLEYLVCQALPDFESGFEPESAYEPGSGYESDQSFYSLGSQSQEGLTDLEKKRRISKDSSDMTSAELNAYDPLYYCPASGYSAVEIHDLKTSDTSCNPHDSFSNTEILNIKSEPVFKGTTKTPKHIYRRHSQVSSNDSNHFRLTEQKTDSEGLQSSSVTSVEHRRSSLTKTIKPKHLYPLTRKPKLRQGEILLDEIPKDYSLVNNTAHSGRENSSTTSEESVRVQRKATPKKQSRLRTLGLLPKSSVVPLNSDDPSPPYGKFIKTSVFQADVSRTSSMDEVTSPNISDPSYDQITAVPSPCHNNIGFNSDENYMRSDSLTSDFQHPLEVGVPKSPSEPGFKVDNNFEVEEDSSLNCADVTPLPGLIGDIAVNSDIGTNIDSPH